MEINKKHIVLLSILFLGFILRLIALDQSLWLDEGIEWWGVTAFDLKKLLTGYMLGDFNPPGHHLLMWFWVRVFGDSEIAMRVPSVLFGVGTVGMVYKISEFIFQNSELEHKKQKTRLHGNFLRTVLGVLQGPSFSALLAATNGLLIYYSQEARMYAMATFFVTASVWAFLKLQKEFSPKLLTAYCLLLTVALYSHYLAWLMIPVFVIGGIRKIGIVRSIAPLLATIPIWPLLLKQLQNGIASAGNLQWAMLSQTTPKNIALIAVKFVTGRVPFPENLIWQLVVGVLVVTFWAGVALGAMRIMREIRDTKGMGDAPHIILLWATVPLALGALIGIVIPVFSYFRFLFVLPAVLILFGRGISSWNIRIVGSFWVVVFLLFSLLYLLVPSNHRENWREAVAATYARDQTGVVIIYPAVQPPFDYYDKGRSTIISPFSPAFSDFSDKVWENGWSAWNISYAQPIFDPEDLVRRRFKEARFKRVSEKHFRGVSVERWFWHSELEYEDQ